MINIHKKWDPTICVILYFTRLEIILIKIGQGKQVYVSGLGKKCEIRKMNWVIWNRLTIIVSSPIWSQNNSVNHISVTESAYGISVLNQNISSKFYSLWVPDSQATSFFCRSDTHPITSVNLTWFHTNDLQSRLKSK